MSDAELNSRFEYHPPKGDQEDRYKMLRKEIKDVAVKLRAFCPPSRELSLAFTHLEQVSFYGNAAIARREK